MVSLGSNLGEMHFLGVRLMPFSISAWRTTLPLPSESWLAGQPVADTEEGVGKACNLFI